MVDCYILSLLPFFFFDVLSTSNNSISLSSSSLNDKMGFFFAPLAFCERGAGVLASTLSISSSSLLSVFRRLLALVAAFLAINEGRDYAILVPRPKKNMCVSGYMKF